MYILNHSKNTKAPTRQYQICNKCVMDTSDLWIEFDDDGVCNHCRAFEQKYSLRVSTNLANDSSLNDLFNVIRSRTKNSKYDVLVGISGGTDSSYAIYLAAKAGLRVLAVHMDNGWDTASALHNVYQLIQLPNVDYISYVLDWNKFRSIQRAFLESGVPDIELPTDIAILKAQFLTARKFGIKSILTGGNVANEGILPSSWMYNPRDMRYSESILKSTGLSPSIFDFLRFGFRDEAYHRVFAGIKFFYPLDSISYDKRLASIELSKSINWRPHRQKHSESIFTRFCQSIYQPLRHGFEYRRAHLSSDICMRKIQRDQAIELLKNHSLSDLERRQDIEFVASKLGYSIEELTSIMSSPPSWYVDFDNRKSLLGFAYDVHRSLHFKSKLSNF